MANPHTKCTKIIMETYSLEASLTEFIERLDYTDVSTNEKRVMARFKEFGKYILDNVQDFEMET